MLSRDPAKKEKDHIEDIRKKRGLGDGSRSNPIIQDFENTLTVVSQQLYKKSTHFLLELIQNADDCQYKVTVPELTITYRNRWLRIDSNETGFAKENVDAICRVGNSTKTQSKGASGYVGEKGIGFKSVFTVADVVWISSLQYSFKFDKNQVLGMIVPIWAQFPEAVKPGYTSMLLQLSEGCKEQEIVDEINSLDPRMLMFLRRLKRISINVDHAGSVQQSTLQKGEGKVNGEEGIQLTHNDKTRNYITKDRDIKDMPSDPMREGITETKILLAFPVDVRGDSDPEPQQVYAFLPVADFGFKFLLQADWLLAASREAILDSSPWNQRLRKAFVEVFVAAAKDRQSATLQRLWPKYLPTHSPGQNFLEQARKDILTSLKNEPVLQNYRGQFVKPSTLTFVPDEFVDSQGQPLTLWDGTQHRYLSGMYKESDFDILKELGVKKLTSDAFLEDLSAFVQSSAYTFRHEKSEDWHRSLTEVLIKLALGAKQKAVLSALELIPLNDGSWVSSNAERIFLPPEGEACDIPGGIQARLIDTKAASDIKRRLLFSSLGIRTLDWLNICFEIADTHRSSAFDPTTVSQDDLVAQTVFLFNSDWRNPDRCNLWFVTEDGSREPSRNLYLDSDQRFSATMFFAGRRDRFQFVHRSYLCAVTHHRDRWIAWLCRYAGLSWLPRLVHYYPDGYSFDMCPDFRFITTKHPSSRWLLLLRDYWSHYATAVDDEYIDHEVPLNSSLTNSSRYRTRAELGKLLVDCEEGKKARLDESYLPAGDLIPEAKDCVPFLDVPEPEDPRWKKLMLLNVGMQGSVAFYMRCLKSIRTRSDASGQKSASAFLEQIQARCSEDEELVRKNFTDTSLIPVTYPNSGRNPRWVRAQECLWAGPECFRSRIPLKNIYPEFRKLFRDVLELRDYGPIDIVHEAKSLAHGHKLERIKDLFRLMQSAVDKDENEKCFDVLWKADIFPVARLETPLGYDRLAASHSAKDWFIADRAHLESAFRGRVGILAFSWEEVVKLPGILKKLGAVPRTLSKAAISSPELIGTVVRNERSQKSWREKVDFILRLIPEKEPTRSKVSTQLRNLEVFTAERVVQKWSLKTSSGGIEGQSSPGQAVLSTEGEVLKVYLVNGYIETVHNPKALVDRFADFCSIPKDHINLLQTVLTESDHAIIEKDFQSDGIPALSLENPSADSDSDDEDDYWKHAPSSLAGRTKSEFGVDSELLRSRAKFLADNIGNIYIGIDALPGSAFEAAARHFFPNSVGGEYTPASSAAGSVHGGQDATSHAPTLNMPGLRVLATRNKSRSSASARQAAIDQTLAYEGEHFVSILLERVLGNAYIPNDHWTSKLRVKSGYRPFDAAGGLHASFTLPDGQGRFTDWLISLGNEDAIEWINSPPVYHLEVKTTAGQVTSEFALTNAEFERARRCTIPDNSQGPPTEVCILMRVFNIKTEPNLLILKDPWALYLDGQLQVKADPVYRAQVSPNRN